MKNYVAICLLSLMVSGCTTTADVCAGAAFDVLP